MIGATLSQIDIWYNEPAAGPNRPKLLSKLALIELCGWLEIEMDRIVISIQAECLNDTNWIRDNVLDKTYGFRYQNHFRPMVVRVVGEYLIRKIEKAMEQNHPGEIDKLVTWTNSLWTIRCSFAHADIVNNVVTMQRFDAPSWSQNQHRVISKILVNFEREALQVVRGHP